MSNLFGPARRLDDSRSVPEGDTVGSYTSYLDAQKAVDYLADQQFKVQLVSIVGNDLKMIERVTGRLSYPRVALTGALQGIWFGLFVGLLLSFFSPTPNGFGMVPFAMLVGAGFWMLFGIISYAAQRGKRDFTSTSQVIAGSYDVIVAREASGEASRLLQNLPMNHAAAQRGQHPQPPYHQGPYNQGPQGGGPAHNGHQGPGVSAQSPEQAGNQPPSRPESWGNPYGAQPGGSEHQAAPSHPGHGSTGNPVEGSPARRGSYPDLPDGRPQYGVRVSPDQTSNPGQTSSPDQTSDPDQQSEPRSADGTRGPEGTEPGSR